MADVVARGRAGLILMHMQGAPMTMQDHPVYAAVIEEISDFLEARVEAAVAAGIDRGRIAVDPGLGFGKTGEQSLAVMGGLAAFLELGRPIVIGPSRKSFLGAVLERPVQEREWGTAAAVAAGVLEGAHVVRVHAVAQMKDVARVAHAVREAKAVSRGRASITAP